MTQPEFTGGEFAAMHAALDAALRGRRGANPLVGAAVLGRDGSIATGMHRGPGTAHAEIGAISAARERDIDLSTATLLVTLEPCHHTGRTGPCTEAIIGSGLRDVVFALPDPNPVAAGGAAALVTAGVRVRQGLMAEDARRLNPGWLAAVADARPFTTAKVAQTLDGYCADIQGVSRWITGRAARARGHEFRAKASAVVVGTGTALADDPRLTSRHPDGSDTARQPVPVVIGRRDLHEGSHLAGREDLLHYRPGAPVAPQPRFLHDVMTDLRARGHQDVLIEGGPGLVGSFIRAGLVDRLLVFTAPVLLGAGTPGVRLPATGLGAALHLRPDPAAGPETLGTDLLQHFVLDPHPTPSTI
jgi:diaminohydroxyphosphoribosylaminopyrimidine deaminase/5-amino-6-(5-phosphoribosylamino)uracil reductase